ncbi:hypothetical protein ILUMI_02298 [Ignelater luminosus]|uniref:Uncharacterized protein n=1 Tax=Ignelater luminosus TaxID=2038154 RepID=A0A8K0DP21_IGNLU|nr:hypothetical protein ILUMI_02298 [Ignelater luminosus]
MKMFAFVFIVCALVQLSNQQTAEQLIDGYVKLVEAAKPDCLKESGANEDVIDKEVTHGEFSQEKNVLCFWKCFLKKYNVINDKDEVQEENVRQFIGLSDEKLVDEIHKKCAPLRGSDVCDTSGKISKCVYTSAKAALAK